MRLKEPMQGIKLVALSNPVTHLAFFTAMFFMSDLSVVSMPEDEMTKWMLGEV